jgi:hypothetical protein
MPQMTEQEAGILDDLLTHTTPVLTDIPGVFEHQDTVLDALDNVRAQYLITKPADSGKTPVQIIGNMVRRELTVNK